MPLKHNSGNCKADPAIGWHYSVMAINTSVGGLYTWLPFHVALLVWAELCPVLTTFSYNLLRQRSLILQQKEKCNFSLVPASVYTSIYSASWASLYLAREPNPLGSTFHLTSLKVHVIHCRTSTFHLLGTVDWRILVAPGATVCLGHPFQDLISNWRC